MNTSPIESYEGAGAYFTFGPGSVGLWIFVILAVLAFVAMGVRMFQYENRHFDEVVADPDARALAERVTAGAAA